jgi:hypothetical protein
MVPWVVLVPVSGWSLELELKGEAEPKNCEW